MPIVETLARDHRALEKILKELAETPGREPRRRNAAFSHLQALLQAHARAEEEVVYRPLSRRQPEEPKVLEAFEEHHVADVLLQELASSAPGGRGWGAKVRVFEELLRHHIKEEELHLFAALEQAFSEAERREMDAEFRALKHERLEGVIGALRRATPAFAGRALVSAQAAAGRYARRGERLVRRAWSQWRP